METKRRGLGSLIPGIEERWPGGEQGVQQVRVDEISPNPYQPRLQYDPEKMAELAASVREHGVMQPLVVRRADSGYQVIAGERRLAAAQAVGLQQVPVVVRECSDREMLELALVENLQREDINCIEAARAYRRLMDEFGMTQEAIAERLGRSRSGVANTLRLLALPDEVQDAILAGRISEGHGRALLGLGEPQAMVALCNRIEREGLSVRQTENLCKPRQPQPTVSRETYEQTLDANVRFLQHRLRDALGTKVTIRPRDSGGMIEIQYYSDEDLDRISTYILREETASEPTA